MRTLVHATITIFAVLVLSGAHAAGQSGGDPDLAKRTFLNAEQLMREGKRAQALKAYEQVIQAYPGSPYADDSLMRVGGYHYPIESVWDLGSVAEVEQEAGRGFFEQVQERYPQSDSASHAAYKLGLLALEPESPRRNLDEAYAAFYSVVNIYPDSAWRSPALRGAAVAEIGKRNYDSAILSLERALEAVPHGEGAAESHFLLGIANARLGDFLRAAEEFQAARLEQPGSRSADRALDWLTLLYNTRLRAAFGAAPRHSHDRTFVPKLPDGKDLRGDISIAVRPDGALVVADPRRDAVLTFSADGSLAGSEPAEEIQSVGFDAFGAQIIVSAGEVRIAGRRFAAGRRKGDSVDPVEEIGGVFRSSKGKIFILDREEGELLRYDADPQDPKVVHEDKEAGTRLTAMAAGPEDRLFFLDDRSESVMWLHKGKVEPLVPAGGGVLTLEEPVALAADMLGNVYVADSRQRAVIVLGPDGREQERISPPADSAAGLEAPAAIAVGPKGEIYIYDERKRTVLRFMHRTMPPRGRPAGPRSGSRRLRRSRSRPASSCAWRRRSRRRISPGSSA